jgi:hypothetical protein
VAGGFKLGMLKQPAVLEVSKRPKTCGRLSLAGLPPIFAKRRGIRQVAWATACRFWRNWRERRSTVLDDGRPAKRFRIS